MLQRVMGHEQSSTTLDLCTRRTDNAHRILKLEATTTILTMVQRPSRRRTQDAAPGAPDASRRTTKALVSAPISGSDQGLRAWAIPGSNQ
jgi:hypothetical protein